MSYIKLVLSLGLVAVCASGEARAKHLAGSPPDFDSDCIAVLVDDDNSLFDAAGKMDRVATANRFYHASRVVPEHCR